MADIQPTFSWTGMGRQEGACIHYTSFTFAGEPYSLGDCVYLLPEEEGAPPYIAKLIRAWEDTTADDAEKLIIEVRWYERRSAVPAAIAAGMHTQEVVASDLTDTNLVGCLDCRATVIRANSYAEACEMLPASQRNGNWHFCRGRLDSATQQFRSFQELGIGPLDDEFGLKTLHAGQLLYSGLASAQLLGQDYATYCCTAFNMQQQQQQPGDVDMPDAAATGSNHASPNNRANGRNSSAAATSLSGPAAHCAANSRSRRAAAAARVAAAAAAAGASNSSVRGIPGKVCCECGATQTPQWREGPLGPKTLCNACGVRYQRSQSKAKSNKRQASERARYNAGADRGSPTHARAPKQACLSNRTAAPGGAAGGETAEDGTAHHGHGTRNAGKSRFHQHKQRAGTSKQHHGQQQQHSQQQHGSSGLYDLQYYEDEGSPPNMNTHILEDDEEEDAMHQQLLRDSLHRSATHDAADALHSLAVPSHARQAQQQQPPVSAGYCSMVMGSPSSSMLLTDHLQSDNIPLLSLDDTVRLAGPDGGLAGPDSLDPHSLKLPDSLNPHSLSPMPRSHRLSITTGGSCKQGTAPAAGGASATCASPGRLIAAMVQGLKLPTPLSLNGGAALPPASAAPPAAADVGGSGGAKQQHCEQQQVAPSPLVPGTDGVGQLSVGLQYQPIINSNGLLLPMIGSSKNISQQLHNSSSGTAANNGTPPAHGSDSAPASAAVSSCDANGTPGNTLQGSSSLPNPTAAGWFSAAAAGVCGRGNNQLLSQLRSLVYRAAAYAPDVQGLNGLYPGPSSPRAVQNLEQQLEQLAEPARAELQQVSAALEENLSKAKAADAAVLAVSQVLAAKKQAAAEARQEVESAMLHFRALLGKVSPAVAAAAPGNGCSSGEACGTVYCSPGACTTAATNCCAAVSSAAVQCTAITAGSGSLVGSSRLGGNSPRVLVSQGLDLGTVGDVEVLGSHSNTVQGLGDNSDADDLIRDPEDEQPAAVSNQQQQQERGATLIGCTASNQQQFEKVQCGNDTHTAAAVPVHSVKADLEQQQPATEVAVKQELQLAASVACHLQQQQQQQEELRKHAAAELQPSSVSADSAQVTGLRGSTSDAAHAVPVQPASAAHPAAEPAPVAA